MTKENIPKALELSLAIKGLLDMQVEIRCMLSQKEDIALSDGVNECVMHYIVRNDILQSALEIIRVSLMDLESELCAL